MIKWRRMKNMVNGVKVGDKWYEQLVRVKEEIKRLYINKFKENQEIKI